MRTALLLAAALATTSSASEWPQFGGPNRNFTSPAKGLAADWPAAGPKVLWSRPLGTKNAWTAPSLSATTLYVRDRRAILAVDLR